eukprot:5511165-Pyramimonas_sp.AAC.1
MAASSCNKVVWCTVWGMKCACRGTSTCAPARCGGRLRRSLRVGTVVAGAAGREGGGGSNSQGYLFQAS